VGWEQSKTGKTIFANFFLTVITGLKPGVNEMLNHAN